MIVIRAVASLVVMTVVGAGTMPRMVSSPPRLPIPVVFAPGIVSGPSNDGAPTFSPDGRTIYFERSYAKRVVILESQRSGAGWSRPQVASFSGPWSDQQPALSPDGRYLIYASSRYRPSGAHPGSPPARLNHLWRVDRTASGWSAPSELPVAVNISRLVFKPSIARNGDLYFMSADSAGPAGPRWRLYRSAWVNGSYQHAQQLSFSDGKYVDVDPYIAPDQSYIIFSSSGRRSPDDGHEHLYISLRQGSGWGPVRALRYAGDDWGADDGETNVTPDGRTLYFTSSRSAPVNRAETRQQMLTDIARSEAWDNGNTNAWSLPLRSLLDGNGIDLRSRPAV